MANAGQLRVTEPGLRFLEDNIEVIIAAQLGEGLLIPRMTGSGTGFTWTACADEDCALELVHQGARIEPQGGEDGERVLVEIETEVHATERGTGIRRPIPLRVVTAIGTYNCAVDVDTTRGSRPTVTFRGTLEFEDVQEGPRAGFARVRNGGFSLTGQEDDDIRIDGACSLAATFVRGQIVSNATSAFDREANAVLERWICEPAVDGACPEGSAAPDERYCRVPGAEVGDPCVPRLLGFQFQGPFGGLFGGVASPDATAQGLFALGQGAEGRQPSIVGVNEGLSTFLVGGLRSTDERFERSPAHHPCVPRRDPPSLPLIPRVAALAENTHPDSDAPAHLVFALPEVFLDYSTYAIFDSGALCLSTDGAQTPQLRTGILSLLLPSIDDLIFPAEEASLQVHLRPQLRPRVLFRVVEGEASIELRWQGVQIDFYVWVHDRFMRFMTYGARMDVLLAVRPEGSGASFAITDVQVNDSHAGNAGILRDDPEVLRGLLDTLAPLLVTDLLGALPNLQLPSFLGVRPSFGPDAARIVEEGGQRWLALYGDAELVAAPIVGTVTCSVEATLGDIDPRAADASTFAAAEPSELVVSIQARGGPSWGPYEYSWRLDGGGWSPWSPSPVARLRSRTLLLQGRHQIDARARVRGEPSSTSEPASAEVLTDLRPPRVTLTHVRDHVRAHARDVITPSERIEVRFRIDGGNFSPWSLATTHSIPDIARRVEVEARDEAGLVGRATLHLRAEPETTTPMGGCSASPAPGASGGIWLALLGIALAARRRRARNSRRLRCWALSFVALWAVACSCDTAAEELDAGMVDAPVCACGAGELCCPGEQRCVSVDPEAVHCPGRVACSGGSIDLDEACAPRCTACPDGVLAMYLDFAPGPDGRIWISGYDPGVAPDTPYGDLVVGRYDAARDLTDWSIVDGLPEGPRDSERWRGGLTEAGPDVGLWTSIAARDGVVHVSYYARTEGSLRLATFRDGEWSTHVVDDQGDAGRYSSLAMREDGTVAIGYARLLREGDTFRSEAAVALATTDTPASSSDWNVEVVESAVSPCRPEWCASGEACLANGACRVPTADCEPSCVGGIVCSEGSCEPTVGELAPVTVPPLTGAYARLVAREGELLLFWQDATNQTLKTAARESGLWTPVVPIASNATAPHVVLDAAGAWHLSYVDTLRRQIRYARLEGGALRVDVVDDGSSDGTSVHPDGRHIVGGDTAIAVTGSGEVRVAYQDTTTTRALLARRSTSGAWRISILDDQNFTGFWLRQMAQGSGSLVATHWRSRTGDPRSGVRMLDVE